MSALCEHLAYDIDDDARIVTVVYIGDVRDDEVIDFYVDLHAQRPDVVTCDYLLDMRYTDWRASQEMIARLRIVFSREQVNARRRLAIVRKSDAMVNKVQEAVLREGLDWRSIRYFSQMGQARDWLLLSEPDGWRTRV